MLYILSFIIFFVTVQEHRAKPSEARSVFLKLKFGGKFGGKDPPRKTDLASEGFGLCSWTVTKKIIIARV